MAATSGLLPLRPAYQQYEWGKPGHSSQVAKLLVAADTNCIIKDSEPYAELWMGTHPKAPTLLMSGEPLCTHLTQHPESVGEKVRERFGEGVLPFLFKVLSVDKSLSIQAHPTKDHAKELHAKDPVNYPDSNHKPELAVALTEFEGLCGFRPAEEILADLHGLTELSSIVGVDHVATLQAAVDGVDAGAGVSEALKTCFSSMMACDVASQKQLTQELYFRLQDSTHPSKSDELFLRLYKWFPDDIGCLVAYFLNHMVLAPGQAMYLAPNVPHNYISGDCIEIMACSDNVVRAGLTPKYKDISTLTSMLVYEPAPASHMIFQPLIEEPGRSTYKPPCPDFTLDRYEVPVCPRSPLPVLDSGSILLVISGAGGLQELAGVSFHPGTVLFIPAHSALTLTNIKNHTLIYRAYCQL